jgi:hypothetical protein
MEILNNEGKNEYELTVEQYRKSIELGEALERLRNNPDFKLLIMENYLHDLPSELAKVMVLVTREEARKDITNEIIGVGALHKFLSTVQSKSQYAKANLAEAQRMMQEGEY